MLENTKVTGSIIACGIKVHKALGPGLLESSYETCLEYELRKAGLKVNRQLELPIHYDGIELDATYFIDLLVEDQIVIEVKSVKALLPVHEAQLLTYLKLSKHRLGLLMNFNVTLLRDGIRRKVN